ncbi:MAG: hypothetical protein KOO63_02925 [Bacteroidales bacterium]|nr:hypothetical protein [Candidatus Latescibacterota bacterium]
MCGICGFAAPKASQEWKYETLVELLQRSEKRGDDATGITFIDDTGKLIVIKDGVKSTDFVKTDEFKALKGHLPDIVLAHTRGVSLGLGKDGAPDDNANNHPFYSPEAGLSLVHNGRIQDSMWRETAGEEGGLLKKCTGGTDSETALRIIETIMVKDTVKEEAEAPHYPDMLDVLDDACFNISGNYTFGVLHAPYPDRLWLVRHNNPMVLAYDPDQEAIVFASDKEYADSVLQVYKEHFGFFYQWATPETVMFNAMTADSALEIRINYEAAGDLFAFRRRNIEAAATAYPYHAKAAKMIEEGQELPTEVLI